jgi:hypothetical protein
MEGRVDSFLQKYRAMALEIACTIKPTITLNKFDRKSQIVKFKFPEGVDKSLRGFLFELIRIALSDDIYEAINFTGINSGNASCEVRYQG